MITGKQRAYLIVLYKKSEKKPKIELPQGKNK